MKASAIAHPIQGLVKYHGLRDPVRRIPFHDSISVATGPIHTRTTVEVVDSDEECRAEVDGEQATGRALERIQAVVDAVREAAGDERPCHIVSRNDFPKFVGLGSSSSGFAALAMAAAHAYGWDPGEERLTQVARLGAGSAARSVPGGVAEWRVKGERSWAKQLAAPEDFPSWRIVVPLVPHPVPTENVHREVVTSPLFQARVDSIGATLAQMRSAVASRDLGAVAALAERDTLSLHAVTMTGDSGLVAWQPATVAAIHTVVRLRDEGVPVWFSIDTGATAYLNTDEDHEKQVAAAVKDVEGVTDVLHLRPGPAARLVDDHLF